MNNLLPPNSTAAERSIDTTLARPVAALPLVHRALWDAATCPAEFLPWLAWTLSVETWNPEWSIATKRSVVSSAVATARHKGSKSSVVEALAAFGVDAHLVEWWQKSPKGTPHTFEVNISENASLSLAKKAAIESEINRTKPLRSHYTLNQDGISTSATINIVGAFVAYSWVRVDGTSTY